VVEPLKNIKAWAEEHGLSYTVISDPDGTALREYSNGSVPYNVVIDQKFKVRYSGNDFDENRFLKTIGELLEQRRDGVTFSRSCLTEKHNLSDKDKVGIEMEESIYFDESY
jgi:hypothetical protein